MFVSTSLVSNANCKVLCWCSECLIEVIPLFVTLSNFFAKFFIELSFLHLFVSYLLPSTVLIALFCYPIVYGKIFVFYVLGKPHVWRNLVRRCFTGYSAHQIVCQPLYGTSCLINQCIHQMDSPMKTPMKI